MIGQERNLEHRAFLRQAITLPIVVESGAHKGPGKSVIEGLTRDISNRGAYFFAEGPFEVGQILHLTLEIPPDQGRNFNLRIQWEAEVTRVEAGKPGESPKGIAVRVLRFETPSVAPPQSWVH